MKTRLVIGILEKNGFSCVRIRGSHLQYKGYNPLNGNLVVTTVAGHNGEVHLINIRSIEKQSGVKLLKK